MTGNLVGWRRRVVGAAVVLVGVTVTAGSASSASGPVETAAAKPVVCTKGQVRVTFLGKTRCRALRTAAPSADQRLPLVRGFLMQDLGNVRTTRGRQIPSLSNTAGGRTGRVQARLARSLPKILAWVDSRVRTTAARTAAAPCAFTGPDNSTTLDGFQISLSQSGDLTVNANIPGGFRVEVFVGSGVSCSQLVLPVCPRADGGLDGTDVHSNRITLRVTKNGALVQSLSTNVRSNQTMRGKVADDAKLDTMILEDTSRDTTTVRVPGDQFRSVLTVRRRAEVDMRGGAPRGTPTVRATFQIVGATQTFHAAVGAEVQRKYEASFPSLISEEVRNYKSREAAWQTPGKCAKLTFDPPTNGTLELEKDQTGQVIGTVEANAGGAAAKGRWTVTTQANGTFSPQTAEGGTSPFQYRVTRAGTGIRLTGTFRATSTAGVAEGTWSQPTGSDAYYKIVSISYNANHNSTWSGSDFPCPGGATSVEQGGSGPIPFDPAGPQRLVFSGGGYVGPILNGPEPIQAHRTGQNHGCDTSSPPPPFPACTSTTDLQNPVSIGVIVDIQPGSTDAKVTWILPPVEVGDGGAGLPCNTQTLTTRPPSEVRMLPAATFLDPGVHTVSVDRNVSVMVGPAGMHSITGMTTASMTFQRVNADGTAYTG